MSTKTTARLDHVLLRAVDRFVLRLLRTGFLSAVIFFVDLDLLLTAAEDFCLFDGIEN